MTESQTTTNNTASKTRKVPLRDRAISAGNIVGINAYPLNRAMLKQSLQTHGYQLCETLHFMIFTRVEAPTTIVAHHFALEEIDADIGDYLMQELKPLGLLTQSQDFENMISAVVCSLFPHDVQKAWELYAQNTLRRYDDLIKVGGTKLPCDSTMTSFATVYRRVFELQVGNRLLDAGCSFGFFPLLAAESFSTLSQVVGIDIVADSFSVIRRLAEERHLANVQFVQADLLADDFSTGVGNFDTVTALHVLEHFSEQDMHLALANLLKATAKRLILVVPFEAGEPEQAYGHKQLFSRGKLEEVGRWCIEQLDGKGQMSYEDCAGGLLLIERIA